MKVVDASVALKWFKQEGGSDESRTLLLEELLIAPELILAKCSMLPGRRLGTD